MVGAPGIGKSRLVREVVAIARRHNVEVFTTFCESHATDVPFRVVARLLRATTGVEGLDGHSARDRVRDRVPDADPEDLLLHDLLGIADPDVAQLVRNTSTVSNLRAWIAGNTAAANTSTVTAAAPVRSGNPSTSQSILMP